ncbi:MAG TPA: adenosylcobinamide amidohydrolase [Methanospirillum sp.]|nr:adenosylcobinamide amidohydrolase [Methanospirillum sp.]
MRYHLTRDTLIIRGRFHACSTGISGGIRLVTTLLNHTVSENHPTDDPAYVIEQINRRNGLSPAASFGLLTAVPMEALTICRYDNVTVFITAGATHPDPVSDDTPYPVTQNPGQGTINIICCITGAAFFQDQALLDAIITVTEAKTLALVSMGKPYAGTVTDAVIIAAEEENYNTDPVAYAGSATPLGRRIHDAVLFGVPTALNQYEGIVQNSRISDHTAPVDPLFFIHTTIGGSRWIQWQKGHCPYYPCHFSGQRCDFCYCPLYPCQDETLGEWVVGSRSGGRVWSCAPCTLNHEPAVVRHLRDNPEASLAEVKKLYLLAKESRTSENK